MGITLTLDEQVRRDFQKYIGVPMEPAEVVVAKRDDGSEVKRNFDLVSVDHGIIASIQTSCLHVKSRPGQKAYGSLYRVLGAILYLHLCTHCSERYLILTDHEMYEEITSEFGRAFQNIIFLYYDDIRKGKTR